MKSAVIPADIGDKKTAWSCVGERGCTWCTTNQRTATGGCGTAEDVAKEHVAQNCIDGVRVHVFEGGRGRTFKVWRGPKGYEAREVL